MTPIPEYELDTPDWAMITEWGDSEAPYHEIRRKMILDLVGESAVMVNTKINRGTIELDADNGSGALIRNNLVIGRGKSCIHHKGETRGHMYIENNIFTDRDPD